MQQHLVKRKTWFLTFRDVVGQMLQTYQHTMNSLVPDLRSVLWGPQSPNSSTH